MQKKLQRWLDQFMHHVKQAGELAESRYDEALRAIHMHAWVSNPEASQRDPSECEIFNRASISKPGRKIPKDLW
jgi:hypothetical protein